MSSRKKIAVVLSGCGNQDGSEVTEAVSLIIGLSNYDAEVVYFAPDLEFTPNNFLTREKLQQTRNMMLESARITRAKIENIEKLNANEFDGLALPGGYGAALHLSTWATEGHRCKVLASLEKAILQFHQQSKPIAAICIAPAIIAKVLGKHKVSLTLGLDPEVIQEIKKTGAIHEECPVDDYITDRLHKVITTPAYMYDDAKPVEVFRGIQGLCKEFIEMA